MGNNQTGKNSKELEHNSCSTLLDDVKQKVRLLRESGVSESEIASLFYVEKPLPMLIIGKGYRIFLGDKQNEVRMEPLVKAVYLLFLKHPEWRIEEVRGYAGRPDKAGTDGTLLQ